MKEYICKEELVYFLKDKYGDECLTSADFDRVLDDISDFFSITESDICREFLDKIHELIVSDLEDRTKVLKIQEYIFKIKGIEQNESEAVQGL